MSGDKWRYTLIGIVIGLIIGVPTSYLGYVKMSTKAASQKTICVVDANKIAENESDKIVKEALGQSKEAASDGKDALNKFIECEKNADPNISDFDFVKKIIARFHSNKPN